ncbi:serine protease [Streptomyces sp. NPDC050211]|uniref:serine protease n=1 Tax=Streptomyces sp. NPDC050211 TaxID=3154932 RepID=UPI0034421D31
MPGTDYAVDLSQGATPLGAGFLLAPCYVLTAHHCLTDMAPGDDRLSVSFGDGRTVDGRVCQRVAEADLALVEVLEPDRVPPTVPFPDLPRPGDQWHGPHRPSHTDPYLNGRVDQASVPYDCEGGGRIEAIQLLAEQVLGNYAGYSGGPVERATPEEELAVLGILVEQYPDRAHPGRNANVLFAATIREALTRFAHFRTAHLLRVLEAREDTVDGQDPVVTKAGHSIAVMSASAAPVPSPGSAPAPSATLTDRAQNPVDTALATGQTLLAAIKEWSAQDLIDPSQVCDLQVHVAKSVIELALRGDVT